MRKQRYWDADNLFLSGIGLLMFAVFAAALGSQRVPTKGSSLVPTAALEKVRAQEARCQTLPAKEALEQPRTRRC